MGNDDISFFGWPRVPPFFLQASPLRFSAFTFRLLSFANLNS